MAAKGIQPAKSSPSHTTADIGLPQMHNEITLKETAVYVNLGLALVAVKEAEDEDWVVRFGTELAYSPMYQMFAEQFFQGNDFAATEMNEMVLRQFATEMFMAGQLSEAKKVKKAGVESLLTCNILTKARQ